jgi:GNAT superfamily N-acetyltransferase
VDSHVIIAPLQASDRAAWDVLARGYKAFYQTPDADYDTAWRRLMAQDGIHGLAAHLNGEMVGFTHYLFHTSTWAPTVCYLQDLFTAEAARNHGVARALIAAVADQSRASGAARLYWLTKADNSRARALYDKVAVHAGFLRYDVTL